MPLRLRVGVPHAAAVLFALVLPLGCASSRGSAVAVQPAAVRTGGGPGSDGPQVRYRPGDPSTAAAADFLAAVPDATWDLGLERAAAELLSLATQRGAVLDPATCSLVAARAGFPGQARFARALGGETVPETLLAQVRAVADREPVDVAVAARTYSDGTALWIAGWAPHRAELEPLPRQIPLDAPLPLRVDLDGGGGDEPGAARVFIAPPDGTVEELSLTSGVSRWVDRFHTPGAYRVEVVGTDGPRSPVALLFTLWVEQAPPEPAPLRPPPQTAADPIEAEAQLYAALDELRRDHGLPSVARFAPFEPLAREHSALMASQGRVAHVLPGVTAGVASKANEGFHPRAETYENVAAATTAADAMVLVVDSPGHLGNLLCQACTHASIGVALEPVLDRVPRLFVTWELLEFPNGEPKPIDRYEH